MLWPWYGDVVMPRAQRVLVAVSIATIGFALTYGLVDYARWPHLHHLQRERRFVWARTLFGEPSGYVGLWLWAIVVGGVAFAAAWLVLGRFRRPLGPRGEALWLSWALTAVALVGGYFTWNNWP
jgi:hypothetical protein